MTTKAEFIARLSENTGLTKKQATNVLQVIGECVYQDLATNLETILPGIGKLKVKHRSERQGRNPRTGEGLTIPARDVVKFSATRKLKQFVADDFVQPTEALPG